MKRKICTSFIFIFVILQIMTGCNRQKEKDAGQYLVYYLNGDGLSLETESFDTDLTDAESLIQALFEEMKQPESPNYKSAFQNTVLVTSYSINNRILYVNFNENYVNMDDVTEIMLRAAVVKTMVQIEGIDYVTFYINDQPLTNDAGNVVGIMSESDFIDNTDQSMNSIQWLEVTLYYADAKGESLVGEVNNLAYSKNVPIEQVIVDKLIDGPDISDAKKSLPSGTKVISVSTKDGTCYVNLNDVFLTSLADVSAEVTIYSIVNSLCELPTIKNVQILVNGSTEGVFREYPLTTIFERNLNLVIATYLIPNY